MPTFMTSLQQPTSNYSLRTVHLPMAIFPDPSGSDLTWSYWGRYITRPVKEAGGGGMDLQFFLGLSHLICVWKFVQFYFSIGKFEDIFLNEYICWIYFFLTTIGDHQFFHLGAVLIWFDFVLDLMIKILLLFWYMFKLKITCEESISFFYVT